MKPILKILVPVLLLFATVVPSFALISLANLSKEQAEELGITMKHRANGDAGVMVWLEFKKEGVLEKFTYAELRMKDADGKHLVSARLQPNKAVIDQPDEIVSTSFSADPAQLENSEFWVITSDGISHVGYILQVKDFFDANELAVQVAKPPASDGWSDVVNGLRARLVFGEDYRSKGNRFPEVYLELSNVSDSSGLMEFDFDPRKSIHFDLRSSDGEPGPKPAAVTRSGIVQGSFPIMIPPHGALKFPITWKGYGFPGDRGTALGFLGASWVIPSDDQSDYFLSATLEIPETPRNSTNARPWHGTVALPGVKVPTATTND